MFANNVWMQAGSNSLGIRFVILTGVAKTVREATVVLEEL